MARKNLLADLIEEKLTTVNSGQEPNPTRQEKSTPPTLGNRGAVGAMSRSLEAITAEREAAKELAHQMAAGQAIVEIDVALLDPSFVPDRMEGNDDQHAALVESIRTSGQLLPILVRPHPKEQGRFQIAYGHRRVRALKELGGPARAVVRDLSDDDLVVAQGKENSERKDLSFIERATYGAALEDRNFKRETIMASLSVDKTELSRLISVARAIPKSLVTVIGPAPKTGRRRWMELVDLLAANGSQNRIAEVLNGEAFKQADSDTRFAMVARRLMPERLAAGQAAQTIALSADDKSRIARVERKGGRLIFSLDEKTVPQFGDFLVDKLSELYREFREQVDQEKQEQS
jgi:ParB family transcriptional regulator, chromosome partitioning protein